MNILESVNLVCREKYLQYTRVVWNLVPTARQARINTCMVDLNLKLYNLLGMQLLEISGNVTLHSCKVRMGMGGCPREVLVLALELIVIIVALEVGKLLM